MGLLTTKRITVTLAELTDTREIEIEEGTHLGEFLQKVELEYNANVRVNTEVKSEDYTLQDSDIITIIGEVSGGVK